LEQPPAQNGSDYMRRAIDANPRAKFEQLLADDKKKNSSKGLDRARELLQTRHYASDLLGMEGLAADAKITVDQARKLLSSRSEYRDKQRELKKDSDRQAQLAAAKKIAGKYVGTAMRNGLEFAAGKIAAEANIPTDVAMDALEQHTADLS
jgi:hypothetical protein